MTISDIASIFAILAVVVCGAWFLWDRIYSTKTSGSEETSKLYSAIEDEKAERKESFSQLDQKISIIEERIEHIPDRNAIDEIVRLHVSPVESNLQHILTQLVRLNGSSRNSEQ